MFLLIPIMLQVDVKKAAPKPANPYSNPKTMRGRGAARGGKYNLKKKKKMEN